MNKKFVISIVALLNVLFFSQMTQATQPQFLSYAEKTLDAIYQLYATDNHYLLREAFPFESAQRATYLDNEEQADKHKPYAYLWPFSGSLSAVNTLNTAVQTNKYKQFFDDKVLPGLELYFDTLRAPAAYASYLHITPLPDRFYDDNVWIGIDFTDMYLQTKDPHYLEKAKIVWRFIESRTDEQLGGGIYWVEQRKRSKHACSNAPGAVYALKLFEATGDSYYFEKGKAWYVWTKTHLQDPTDFLIYDNIRLNGSVDKKKYAYNSGQMIEAAALLYKFSKDTAYLREAQQIAESAYQYFFQDFSPKKGEAFHLLNKGNVWFSAVMLRGYIALYHQDGNKKYMDNFKVNLDYAWKHMRDQNGLFNTDWSGTTQDKSKWLLTQFAMVEMYARMSNL